MRPQDWAFFVAAGATVFTIAAAMSGAPIGAIGGVAMTVGAAWASRVLSRKYRAPMPHVLRWGLLWPRGLHSPRRLRNLLQPRSGEHICELGPGIGAHAIPVAAALGPAGRLDVVDIQRPMLDHLLRRIAKARLANIAPVVGDATRLPYASASFDAAYAIDVLGETPDEAAVLGELRRVLKPDGRLVIGEHFIDPDYVSLRALQAHAEAAGFTLQRTSGTSLMYLARFRPTRIDR